ncbi:MAG: mitofilin family membrane protein [Alteraurantiacibacter sp.]
MDETRSHPSPGTTRRRSMRGVLLGVFAAFLLGIGLTVLLLRGGEWRLSDLFAISRDVPPVAVVPLTGGETAAPSVTPNGAVQVAERVEQVEQQAGGIDSRVAALEQQLTHLQMQSQASTNFAVRSENMLIAFASRRALERGQPLGYLADQLRLRFSETHPNAVQTIIDASANPVSLDELLVRLDALGGQLEEVPAEAGLLARIQAQASRLFSIRTEDAPSPVAQERLARARAALANGQVERAIGEVRQLPGAPLAGDWLRQAQAYADAQRALEVLEAASVAEPRTLQATQAAQAAAARQN